MPITSTVKGVGDEWDPINSGGEMAPSLQRLQVSPRQQRVTWGQKHNTLPPQEEGQTPAEVESRELARGG